MKKCLVEVYNSSLGKAEWIPGEVIGERTRLDLDCNGYDVKTAAGIYEGCHPNCVKIL